MVYAPKWLEAPDVLAIMRAGSELGLGYARTQATAEEARARTRLGYANIASDNARSSNALAASQYNHAQALAQERENATARAAEALRSHTALELDRGERTGVDIAAQALRERHQGFLERTTTVPTGNKAFHIGDSLVEMDKNGNVKELYKGRSDKLSQLDNMQLNSAIVAKRQAELARADILKGGLSPEKYDKIIADSDAIIKRFSTPAAPTPAQAAETLTAPPRTPFIYQGSKAGEVRNPQIPPLEEYSDRLTMSGTQPAALPTPASTNGVIVIEKKTGKRFRYKGDPSEVPTDTYDIVPP